jgi:hypothetical protein
MPMTALAPGLGRVLHHQAKGVFARSLAQLGVERDVAAGQRLQRRADIADNAARADDDAAHDTEIADDVLAG